MKDYYKSSCIVWFTSLLVVLVLILIHILIINILKHSLPKTLSNGL